MEEKSLATDVRELIGKCEEYGLSVSIVIAPEVGTADEKALVIFPKDLKSAMRLTLYQINETAKEYNLTREELIALLKEQWSKNGNSNAG